MRSYIVIPAGTPVLLVEASEPHYAVSKAIKGRDVTHVTPLSPVVLAQSRSIIATVAHVPMPGQLQLVAPPNGGPPG